MVFIKVHLMLLSVFIVFDDKNKILAAKFSPTLTTGSYVANVIKMVSVTQNEKNKSVAKNIS